MQYELELDGGPEVAGKVRPKPAPRPRLRRTDEGQPFLPGCQVARLDSLFFGIRPDGAAALRITAETERLRAEHGLTGRPLGTKRLHVSLHGVGIYEGVPAGIETRAIAAAGLLREASFEICFDRAMSFGQEDGGRPLVLCGRGEDLVQLHAFHRRLGEVMKTARLGNIRKSFTPHMTLLYDRRAVAAEAIAPIRWRVESFVLVHSLQGLSRHHDLCRWELAT
jgi:2'-5' RNA ligase